MAPAKLVMRSGSTYIWRYSYAKCTSASNNKLFLQINTFNRLKINDCNIEFLGVTQKCGLVNLGWLDGVERKTTRHTKLEKALKMGGKNLKQAHKRL